MSPRPALFARLAAMLSLILPAGVAVAEPEMAVPPTSCAAIDAPLPAPFASWSSKVDLISATTTAGLSGAVLAPGQAANVALHGTREVSYPVQPEKPGGSVAHGGLLAVSIDQAATYHLALSSGAWIDLIKEGRAEVSVGHSHGPPCSTLRKIVDFTLQPGQYVVQISANADARISVLLTKAR